jgi:hypothetical protein
MTVKRELISLEKWPSMAAPWSSENEGEGWQWGDFLISVQNKPITLGEVFARISGEQASIPMMYHYAAIVYYHPDSNPHGKSIRPILCVGIEQMDPAKLMAAMAAEGMLKKDAEVPNDMPIMVGIFNSEAHLNLGSYKGNLDLNGCRSRLFDAIKDELELEGYPNKIGSITAVKQIVSPSNNVATKNANSNSGCLGFLILMALIPFGIWTSINYFI